MGNNAFIENMWIEAHREVARIDCLTLVVTEDDLYDRINEVFRA